MIFILENVVFFGMMQILFPVFRIFEQPCIINKYLFNLPHLLAKHLRFVQDFITIRKIISVIHLLTLLNDQSLRTIEILNLLHVDSFHKSNPEESAQEMGINTLNNLQFQKTFRFAFIHINKREKKPVLQIVGYGFIFKQNLVLLNTFDDILTKKLFNRQGF